MECATTNRDKAKDCDNWRLILLYKLTQVISYFNHQNEESIVILINISF